jgi:pyruvate formate lyase activating enzyme
MMGWEMSAAEVFRDVAADAVFYERSGGGVTLSGGEPLAQPEFTSAILKRCKKAGIATALDTCGHTAWDTIKEVLKDVDVVLYDFKHSDTAKHRKLTGVPNELILENARRIVREFPDIIFIARVPVIPGCNDDAVNMAATAELINELGKPVKVHFLPYHRLGETKYERMEITGIPIITPPTKEHMEELRGIFSARGLTVIIGG